MEILALNMIQYALHYSLCKTFLPYLICFFDERQQKKLPMPNTLQPQTYAMRLHCQIPHWSNSLLWVRQLHLECMHEGSYQGPEFRLRKSLPNTTAWSMQECEEAII